MQKVTRENASEKMSVLKAHRSAAKKKIHELSKKIGLGTIDELEKQLRIVQACNNKLKEIKHYLSIAR